MKEITADLVLIIHFIIVVFISSLFLLIPMDINSIGNGLKN